MLVAAGVGSELADVPPLVCHPHVGDLDGRAVQVRGVHDEADPAFQGRVGVVGAEPGVEHGDVDPLSVLGLVDPCDLWVGQV